MWAIPDGWPLPQGIATRARHPHQVPGQPPSSDDSRAQFSSSLPALPLNSPQVLKAQAVFLRKAQLTSPGEITAQSLGITFEGLCVPVTPPQCSAGYSPLPAFLASHSLPPPGQGWLHQPQRESQAVTVLRCLEQGLPTLKASPCRIDSGGEREFGAP